jgi:iron(III) transport system permease protein
MRFGRLTTLATLIGALCALPVASVFINLFAPGTTGTWQHLAQTILPEYAANTLWLLFGVGAGVTAVGVATAWLTAMHEFPGRRAFEWALILPLAMPAYVIAFVYTDLLQFVGPVQTWLRELTSWSKADYWFPEVRSLGGAVAMFIFVLYPYVYLLARGAFLERSASLLEAGRTLGLGSSAIFFRVALPLARPAIVAGTALALMETIADFGTVSYLHDRHLSGVVLDGRARGRRAALGRAARVRGAGAAARAPEPRSQAFSRNLPAHARPVAPAPCRAARCRRHGRMRNPVHARIPAARRIAAADGGGRG